MSINNFPSQSPVEQTSHSGNANPNSITEESRMNTSRVQNPANNVAKTNEDKTQNESNKQNGNTIITYDIHAKYGVIGTNQTSGWKREVNVVSWNGREAKLDIRDWKQNHQKMGRGLTFTGTEAMALRDILNGIKFEDLNI